MLDIQFIRDNSETVQRIADAKGIQISIVDLLAEEQQKRHLQQEVDELRRVRNERSRQVAELVQANEYDEAERTKQAVKEVNEQLVVLEAELSDITGRFEQKMMLVPNTVSPDTPFGRSDADNVELRREGEPATVSFQLKDHMELGQLHNLFDAPRGVKVAGTRNYYLKGAGVLLHRAVQQLALDLLIAKGFTLLDVPLMVREETMTNTGFFPLALDQAYQLAGEDKWLVGTSEAPLVSYFSNEIIHVTEPIKIAAASTCFRSEVGSAGKDVHGLYRVHQFAKVEQVILCAADPDLSEQLLQEITRNAEELLQLLELPYRVMAVCTGDMSQKTYKQMDIETWMPSRNAYGETHSSSDLRDFQARRSHIRYRDLNGKLRYCYTLNNTAVASPRILIPLLENHQEEDGSVRIPKALQPYMAGITRLVPIVKD